MGLTGSELKKAIRDSILIVGSLFIGLGAEKLFPIEDPFLQIILGFLVIVGVFFFDL